MFGSQVLEVAIGLVFIYCVLSLLCSLICEGLAGLVRLRARTLEQGIAALLKDPAQVQKLYAHPLISSLAAQGWFGRLVNKPARPSYIPGHAFAAALLDAFLPAGTGDTGEKGFDAIRAEVAKLKDDDAGHLKGALLPLLDGAEASVAGARAAVEGWFNDCMDRVSGWYRRKTQVIAFGVALVLTLAVNADTVGIAKKLYSDSNLRGLLTSIATTVVTQPAGTGSGAAGSGQAQPLQSRGSQTRMDSTTSPANGANPRTPGGGSTATAGRGTTPERPGTGGEPQPQAPSEEEIATRLPAAVQYLDRDHLRALPLGWPRRPATDPDSDSTPGWLLGLLITALAISLGSPVWFDLLAKLVNIRATGKEPGGAKPSGTT